MASQRYQTLEQQYLAGDKNAAQAIVALAESGDPDALFKAAEFRLRGIFGRSDPEGANKLVARAAGEGHVEARRAMAYFTGAGIGTKADPAKARQMLGALAKEDRFAAVQLAFLKHVQCSERLKTAQRQLISTDPHIELIQSLFSPEECRYVQMLAKPWLEPAKVYSEAGGSMIDPQRDADNMAFVPLTEDLVIQSFNQCIAEAATLPVAWGEPLHVMRYGPGQKFLPHHDAHGPGRGKRRRRATALLYLNSEYEGGETHFPALGFRVRGAVGDLLIFHNLIGYDKPDPRMVHAGLPIIRGEKWLATRWIRGCDFFGGR
jgi:prolyl 4-hydroxylase